MGTLTRQPITQVDRAPSSFVQQGTKDSPSTVIVTSDNGIVVLHVEVSQPEGILHFCTDLPESEMVLNLIDQLKQAHTKAWYPI